MPSIILPLSNCNCPRCASLRASGETTELYYPRTERIVPGCTCTNCTHRRLYNELQQRDDPFYPRNQDSGSEEVEVSIQEYIYDGTSVRPGFTRHERDELAQSDSQRGGGLCQCGCGFHTIRGAYIAGHKNRYKSALIAAANDRIENAIEKLAMLGWSVDRRFGVELEFFGVDGKTLVEALRYVGIKARVDSYHHDVVDYWKIVTDGSVTNQGTDSNDGLEIVSPILLGEKGLRELALVVETMRLIGAKVDKTCGFHVHVEAAGLGLEDIKRVVFLYHKNRAGARRLLNPDRLINAYCEPWSRRALRDLEGCQSLIQLESICLNFDHHQNVNLGSYPRYGTIEFREHQGTLDSLRVISWTATCVRLTHLATEKYTHVDLVKILRNRMLENFTLVQEALTIACYQLRNPLLEGSLLTVREGR